MSEENLIKEETEETEPWDLLADALGSLSELEDDEEEVDYAETFEGSGGELDPFHKVPLEQAGNLLKLRKLAASVEAGSLTVDKFTAEIRRFIQPMQDGLKMLKSAPVQAQIEERPEEELNILLHLQDQLKDLLDGLKMMERYKQSEKISDVHKGLELVEDAMDGLDNVQDHAIDLGREQVLESEGE